MRKYGVIGIIVCVLLPAGVFAQSSENYSLTGGDLNSGGRVEMSSANYTASTTIGQSSPVGTADSTSYQVQIGVQYIYASQGTSTSEDSYLLWTK